MQPLLFLVEWKLVNRGDIAIGLFAVLFGVALVVWIIPAQTGLRIVALVSPMFFAKLCAWILVASGIGLAVAGLFSHREDILFKKVAFHLSVTVIATVGLGAAVFAMQHIGFLVTGFTISFVTMRIAGEKDLRLLVGCSVFFPLFIWLAFDVMLSRPLP